MDEKTENIYDQVQIQLQDLAPFSFNNVHHDIMTNPTIVAMATASRSLLAQNAELRNEIATLKVEVTRLIDANTELKVQLASQRVGSKHEWLKMILGIMAGWGGNIVYTEPNDASGWMLTIVPVAIMLVLYLINKGE